MATALHPFFEHTIFINLAHRIDRLDRTLRELKKIGIDSPERFDAVRDTNHGIIGCTKSHLGCMKIAKEKQYPFVFICEDDIQFTDPDVFQRSIRQFSVEDKIYDVLMISANNFAPYRRVHEYAVQVSCAYCCTGYIVRQEYYDAMIENFSESIVKMEENPTPEILHRYAVDINWTRLQKKDRWWLVIPLTVSQFSDRSDILQKNADYSKLMLSLDFPWLKRATRHRRSMFFV
jgi:GR25 family glycosyltransferase involved in LPS biosynthesis